MAGPLPYLPAKLEKEFLSFYKDRPLPLDIQAVVVSNLLSKKLSILIQSQEGPLKIDGLGQDDVEVTGIEVRTSKTGPSAEATITLNYEGALIKIVLESVSHEISLQQKIRGLPKFSVGLICAICEGQTLIPPPEGMEDAYLCFQHYGLRVSLSIMIHDEEGKKLPLE